ncbi:hypothetical protein Hamer_G024796 [Homarus americanus]|uniref:Uncharacterized protein n=1 Tax=Homarus americanus TaxID=6706 RepID=A0A8J5JJW8_HOMAM|nr:hypothetical protein Hamer_G024796 [Homarus americanus]
MQVGTVRPTSSTTRSATEIYLVGQPASSIRGSKLPTMRQVLKFFFHTVNESGDRQETFKETVRNVLTFWNLARIKTISERGCREKLTRLWEHWRSLQKSRDRAAKDKDIGAPDAVEDIEKNRLLTPADKQQDIAFSPASGSRQNVVGKKNTDRPSSSQGATAEGSCCLASEGPSTGLLKHAATARAIGLELR